MIITFAMIERYGKDSAEVTRYKRVFKKKDQELTADYIKKIVDKNGMDDLYWLIGWLCGTWTTYERWISTAYKYQDGKRNVDFTNFLRCFEEKIFPQYKNQ